MSSSFLLKLVEGPHEQDVAPGISSKTYDSGTRILWRPRASRGKPKADRASRDTRVRAAGLLGIVGDTLRNGAPCRISRGEGKRERKSGNHQQELARE